MAVDADERRVNDRHPVAATSATTSSGGGRRGGGGNADPDTLSRQH